mmetsp:Transcript_19492/g.28891  ORF Transcript_19492/g.28891 Transcript_19492/m.28891 type:complete len:568 (+) Transcript_19492:41-1744(+)
MTLQTDDAVTLDPVQDNPRTLDHFLEEAWYKKGEKREPGLRSLVPWQYWFTMLACGVANSSDASEILCLSYILSNKDFQKNFLQDVSWSSGFLASAVFFGMLVGGLVVGTLGDSFGRRPMLILGLLCNSVAGILSAVSSNVWQLSALRCIAGLGIGATVPPLFTLVTEISPPSQRGAFVTLCASFWMVGSIYVALVALFLLDYLRYSWRIFAVACALPSIIGAVLVGITVHESPRFLAIHQQQEEALDAINKLALRMNYKNADKLYTRSEMFYHYPTGEPVHYTYKNFTTSSVICCITVAGEGLRDFARSTSNVYSINLWKDTLSMQAIWFSLNFGTYGILTWITSIFAVINLENMYFNALLFSAANLPGNIASAYFIDRIGRTCMLVISSLASAASLLLFAFFAEQRENSSMSLSESFNVSGIVISACCFQASSISAWNTIDTMTSERFPTSIRSTGMGVCAASGRIGAMLAQIVNAALVQDSPVRILLVASFSLLVSAIVPLLCYSEDFTKKGLVDDFQHDSCQYYEEIIPISDAASNKSDALYLRPNTLRYQKGSGQSSGILHE